MLFLLRVQLALLLASMCLFLGCNEPPNSVPMSDPDPKFPFEHPDAKEANRIFLTLEVYSENDYRNLPRRDRCLWDVSWFETEVMNGGVDQYFYNSAGDHAAECLEALEAINAKGSSGLLKLACDLFPEGRPSPNREDRQEQLRQIVGDSGHIDDLIEGEIEYELYQLMLGYYRRTDPEAK